MSILYSLYLNCNIDNTGNQSAEVSVREHEITKVTEHIISAGVGYNILKRKLDVIDKPSGLNMFIYTLDVDKIPDIIKRMKTQMLLTIDENEAYFRMCKLKLKGLNLSKNNG